LIESVSLLSGIGSTTNWHETVVQEVAPFTFALQVFDVVESIDYADIECKAYIFHLGMKNLTIPPAGTSFLGVMYNSQVVVSPTFHEFGDTTAPIKASV